MKILKSLLSVMSNVKSAYALTDESTLNIYIYRRSNVVVSPEKYYKDNTMAIHNKAKVKICGDKRVFEINAVA